MRTVPAWICCLELTTHATLASCHACRPFRIHFHCVALSPWPVPPLREVVVRRRAHSHARYCQGKSTAQFRDRHVLFIVPDQNTVDVHTCHMCTSWPLDRRVGPSVTPRCRKRTPGRAQGACLPRRSPAKAFAPKIQQAWPRTRHQPPRGRLIRFVSLGAHQLNP